MDSSPNSWVTISSEFYSILAFNSTATATNICFVVKISFMTLLLVHVFCLTLLVRKCLYGYWFSFSFFNYHKRWCTSSFWSMGHPYTSDMAYHYTSDMVSIFFAFLIMYKTFHLPVIIHFFTCSVLVFILCNLIFFVFILQMLVFFWIHCIAESFIGAVEYTSCILELLSCLVV